MENIRNRYSILKMTVMNHSPYLAGAGISDLFQQHLQSHHYYASENKNQ